MKTLTVMLLCLMLCFTGVSVPEVSGAVLTASIRTALVACLQQEYLMRDVYQNLYTRYPTLAALDTVAKSEDAMIVALKKLFAKYRITVPVDTASSAARAIADRVMSVSGADVAAINLERSTAALMDRLLQATRNTDAIKIIALIKATSLGSHTTAFAAEQAGVSTPSPIPLPAVSTQRIVAFMPSQPVATFLALLSDMSVDVIELSGTYRLPCTNIDVDRTRPVVIRPAAGATVVLSGANVGSRAQFEFGCHGVAGNITMQGLVFDGFILGQQGIIYALNCHDITLDDMVVRNSRANGTTAKPYHAWAIYLSSTSTVQSTNFTANRWTVDGSARGMSALQVYGGNHITATDWSVTDACLAVYASGSRGTLTDFVLDGWAISDTGAMGWGTVNGVSVYINNASGRFSNMRVMASGVLINVGTPRLIDDGGNSL